MRLCRTGDGTYLDYGVLFRVMDLAGLPAPVQLDTFGKVKVIEAEHLKAQAERIKNIGKKG